MEYADLGIASIEANPDQPRKDFDPEALAELAASIAANGLLEPIIVRPHPAHADRWLIIAGERRWRAAKQAEKVDVPCRILDVDEITAFELSIAENVNRHDMNALEEAQAYATLLGYGRDQADVSRLFGKTAKYVSLRLELLNLSEDCQAQVGAGRIAVSVASMMSRLNAGNQQAMLFRLMKGEFANDNEALHFAYALREGEDQTSMFDVVEPDLAERETRKRGRAKVLGLIERAEVLSDVMGELAVATPEEYAAVGPDAKAVLDRLDRLQRQLTKAVFNARQGSAVATARTSSQVGLVVVNG